MSRIVLPEKQKYDIKISNVIDYNNEEYKKIYEEADERIKKYHKSLSKAYIDANNFVARTKVLKRK